VVPDTTFANVAEQYVHIALPADGSFVSAMANLATATSADSETDAVLTKTISTVTNQLAAKDIWGKAEEAEIKLLVSGRAINTPAPAAAYIRKSISTTQNMMQWPKST
jgi:hypothetical protein